MFWNVNIPRPKNLEKLTVIYEIETETLENVIDRNGNPTKY
jgi:hypothetical protein